MKRRQSERGTVALEFALLLPVVLLLVGTMIITGMRGVYSALAVHEARIAAREASIRKDQSTSLRYPSSSPYPSETDICNPSERSLAFPGSILIQCEVRNLSKNLSQGDGDVVTVTLTYELRPLTALANFVASSFSAADLAILTQRASVMRE